MIAFDENSLICDLAETYNIYEYRDLPPEKVAVFAIGLRNSSRIKMKMSGQNVTLEELLLGSIVDRLSIMLWFQTKDGQKGRNRPKFVVDSFDKKEKQELSFRTSEEFEKMKERILKGG